MRYNNEMFYIVGLGNPGHKYKNTRHNIGWTILDSIREHCSFSSLHDSSKFSGKVSEGMIGDTEVMMLYPDTYMNNSGAAVVKFVPSTDIKNLIVVHDDIDLPFGEIKIGYGKGAGGNNGVKSIIEKLGTKDFIRVRIGIAPTSFWTGETKRPKGGGPLERFVLKTFSSKEAKQLTALQKHIVVALETVMHEGVETAMNQYN